jgi:beta-lactam-binding protein with PASTA domain
MGWKKGLITGGKAVAKIMAPEMLELGAKIGSEIYEQQKSLIKIPDLKDVHIDEAMRILGDELHLTPTMAIANPNVAFADESVSEVMYSEPRFGSRVNPGTAIKVYYLTQEVIEKSKVLLGNEIREFKTPIVIGLNVYEAREDLERLGLKIAEKLEKPNVTFADKEDGQVTRVVYPNGQKVGAKLKTGERVWVYYVNDEVIHESLSIKDKREKDKQDMIEKFGKVTQKVSKEITSGAIDASKSLSQSIGKQFGKNKVKSDEKEDQ